MKRSLCAIVWLLILSSFIFNSVYAQQPAAKEPPQEPKTKLEAFEKQTGTIVIKGYSEIGKIQEMGKVSVDCIELTDPSTGKKQFGVIIEVAGGGKYEREDRSFIDYEEIDPLIRGIEYISKVTTSSTKLKNFEALYKTKGDVQVVTFSISSGKIDAAIKSGRIGTATAYVSLAKLATFRDLLTQAKQKIDSIK
jgi:hypothetical protein